MSKSNSDIDVVSNFQPMPKRFMVWDNVGKRFLIKRLPDSVDMAFSIFELPLEIDCLDEEEKKQFTICQSTNLFDKDGKEIFEGSIVDFTYWKAQFTQGRTTIRGVIGCDSLGHYIQRIGGSVKLYLSNYAICHETLEDFYKDFALVGHILSNPELMGD